MKFLLTSAGLTNEYISKALIELVDKPKEEVTFLFIPTAANLETGDKSWLEENITQFRRQGFRSVEIIDIAIEPKENIKVYFESADIICFGGGNEQYLAKVMEDVNIKEYLKDQVYVGISAGSMVAGKFIGQELMKSVYPEEIYEQLGQPLSLVDICFIPHLNSEWFTRVRKENLERLKPSFKNVVYSTDDETALRIEGGEISIVGKGEYWVSNA